jgi:CO dehydrogenase maturation factor
LTHSQPTARSTAHRAPGPPLRLAFVGKGGAGKSSIVGTFSRLLARRTGEPVLILDSDPMPGLAYSLGVEPDDAGPPAEAVEPGPEGGPRYVLRDDWGPDRLVDRVATRAPDGVRLLQVGKSGDARPSQPALHAYQQVIDALGPDAGPSTTRGLDVRFGSEPVLQDWHVVGDLPGGTRQPFMGWGRFADTFLVVVEPSAKSVLSARRLAHLAAGWSHGRTFTVRAVANKVRDEADADWIAEHTRLEVVGAVPWDADVEEADRAGRAPLDHAPGGAAVDAVGRLLDRMLGPGEGRR